MGGLSLSASDISEKIVCAPRGHLLHLPVDCIADLFFLAGILSIALPVIVPQSYRPSLSSNSTMATPLAPTFIDESKVPTIVQWTQQLGCGTEQKRFLGLRHDDNNVSSAVTLSLHFDLSRRTFSLKLPVPLRTGIRGRKTNLYIIAEPSQVSQIELCVDSTVVPENVLYDFVTERQCLSSTEIVSIRFSLTKNVVLVAPNSRPTTRSALSKDIVNSMLSLGQADSFTIYFSSTRIDAHHLSRLCTEYEPDFSSNIPSLNSLYSGHGGRNIHCLNDLFQTPVTHASNSAPAFDHDDSKLDSPPAYDEAPLSPPRPQREDSPDIPPIRKRKRALAKPLHSSPSQPESWRDAFAKQSLLLATLSEQVAALQDEMHSSRRRGYESRDAAVQTTNMACNQPEDAPSPGPTPSTCSTVDDHVPEALYEVEKKLTSVLSEFASLQSSVRADIAKSVRVNMTRLSSVLHERVTDSLIDMKDLSEQVDEQVDALRNELVDYVDDVKSGMKVELTEFIAEEIHEVEAKVRAKIRTALISASVNVELSDDSDF